jgi:acetoin utilization deacetylase AcuC-like enzyme
MEPRRADYVAHCLVKEKWVRAKDIQTPSRISYEDLRRVHSSTYLEAVQQPEMLGRIFGTDPSETPAVQVLETLRVAVGGTVAATRWALQAHGNALNLLGGFHHAFPEKGGGGCAFNDLAVALAVVRAGGFEGTAWVIDLDAHPPDGTAACLSNDSRAHLSSLSCAKWVDLPGVDETVLPLGTSDKAYLEALDAMLRRGPRANLAFVIAGGDVLEEDRMGTLGLSLEGARERDVRVANALRGVPSVWLPGGGYQPDSWKVLAGTAVVLLGKPKAKIRMVDPLISRMQEISRETAPEKLTSDPWTFSEADFPELYGHPAQTSRQFLGFYSTEGLEYALHEYGFLSQLERLGYGDFRIELSKASSGERMRLLAQAQGQTHVLVELVAQRTTVLSRPVLFVHWMSLRHPLARFSPKRGPLPGQDAPGLGMAKEAVTVLGLMSLRLGLEGVAFRPAQMHMAYIVRHVASFADPEQQGRFEALLADLGHFPLSELTQGIDQGQVLLNGAPYAWEAGDMVAWTGKVPPARDEALIARAHESSRFSWKGENVRKNVAPDTSPD